MGMVTFEDSESNGLSDVPLDYWELWMVTQDDTASMDDRDEAAAQLIDMAEGGDPAAYCLGKEYPKGEIVEKGSAKAMEYLTQSAEAGNQYAQYALGKLYLSKQDQGQAHYWFTQSVGQGKEYAQFFLERWDSLRSPPIMLSVTRLLYTVFREQAPVPSVPGGIRIDRKRLAQFREKKITMGHKPDDHEEQTYIGPSL